MADELEVQPNPQDELTEQDEPIVPDEGQANCDCLTPVCIMGNCINCGGYC